MPPEEGTADGEAVLKSIVVPLDGSELAESVLPMVAGLAKKLNLAVVLFRAYNLPYSVYGGGDGYSAINFDELIAEIRDEAREYLEKKIAELKKLGIENVSYIARDGFSSDEIIKIGRETQSYRDVQPRTVRREALGVGQRDRNRGAPFRKSGHGFAAGLIAS